MGILCCKEEEIDFDAEVELSHFHLLRSVGKGAFGKVRVVQHKHSKVLYALKYINKAKCIKMKAVENIIQERRLLEEIEYPLVCNLRYAFQDDENLFMVLDLMLGGDLRFHLDRQGQMKEDVVKFYVAEVSLGLNYLHSKKIVHRDLKPDNVLLDEKGHAHLTDFNIAVHYTEKKLLTSVAGSMAYMAPEILTKKGYFDSVDWWSLGIVMYELLFSKRPFRGKTNSALTQAILRDAIQFPENVHEIVSEECIDVLKRFCQRDIKKRLGCNGIDEIKRHPWFKGIQWDKLDTKEAEAPFVPDSKRANFDATHELEELLLEDNPLKAKKRANPNQDLRELSKEMRMMEEKFLIYDFTKMRRRSYFTGNNNLMSNYDIKDSKRRNSQSSYDSTTVERATSTPPALSKTDFGKKDRDTDMTMLPTPPPSARLIPTRHEAVAMEDDERKINKDEWLNERPAPPQNRERRRSAMTLSSLMTNGRSSPIINESDYFSMKPPYSLSGRTTPSSSTMTQTTTTTTTPLTPPPRIQSPIHLIQATASPPVSPTSAPIPRRGPRNVSSSGSLRQLGSPTESMPPPFPPPTTPLPPTPNESTVAIANSDFHNPTTYSPMLRASSPPPQPSSRVLTLSPPATNRRPQVPSEVIATTTSKQIWSSGDFGEATGTNQSTTSRNSVGSGFTEHSGNRSRVSGHFRSGSDVSNGSGALSAVGVPTGL